MSISMKTVVRTLGTKSIKRSKIIGAPGKKKAGFKVGQIVNLSVKKGEFKDAVSRKGTKHKAILGATRAPTNSSVYPGIRGIRYSEILVLLIDNNKKAPMASLGSLNIPVDGKVNECIRRMDRANKRKTTMEAHVL